MSGTTDIEVPETLHIEDEPAAASGPRERPLSPREQIMAEAVRKAHARMERDLELGDQYHQEAQAAGLTFPEEEAEEPAPVVEAMEPVVAAPVVVAPAPVAPVVASPPAAHDTLHTIVIDGQPVRVTDEQYADLAKLGMIANIALHQPPTAPPVAPAPVERRPLVDDARAKEAVRAIQFSDVDAAVPHLTALIEDVISRVPPTPVPQQIDYAAVQRAAADSATIAALNHIKFQAEQAQVRQEFPEVFADPANLRRAAVEVEVIRHRDRLLGIQRPDLDVYREAGHTVYDGLGKPRPGSDVVPIPPVTQAAAPEVTSRNEVIERKRAAPRNTQTVDRRAAPAETTRAPTGSEIVERMRQQRGQPSLR